jgi:hypothetical protein
MLRQGLVLGFPCCHTGVPCAMLSHAAQCPMLLRQGDLGLPTWVEGGLKDTGLHDVERYPYIDHALGGMQAVLYAEQQL